MEHRTVNSNKEVRRKVNKPMIVMAIINLIFSLLLVSFIISLNMVPIKFVLVIFAVLCIFNFGLLLMLKSKRKILKIIGFVISFILIFFNSLGMYYIGKTNGFLNKAFGNGANTYTNTYYVVTLNNDKYSDINSLNGSMISYYNSTPHIDEALIELGNKIDYKNEATDDLYSLFVSLKKGKVPSILLEKSLYTFVFDSLDTLNSDDYKIVYSFDMEFEEEIEEISSDGDSFNIYIGGADFTESNHDFNMIVTVNRKTHKILLTSTPRDFYVPVYGKNGKKDLLGYAATWGINTSRKTLEELYDINIDYYIKINTASLVGLVDTLGGINYCSDKAFTTDHAMVTGTYDDTKGKKLYVAKGCKEYTGIQILTIARERRTFVDGDRQRQKNCQQIMINIFNKMMRPEILTNYTKILDAVSDFYITNIPREMVTNLATDTLNGAKWTFEQQSVTGYDSSGYVRLSNLRDYVMIPDEDSVSKAIVNIKKFEVGK